MSFLCQVPPNVQIINILSKLSGQIIVFAKGVKLRWWIVMVQAIFLFNNAKNVLQNANMVESDFLGNQIWKELLSNKFHAHEPIVWGHKLNYF